MKEENDLGPDCLAGTDDDINLECPGFPIDWFYDQTYCQCVASDVCDQECETGEIRDPIGKCDCLSEKEHADLIAQIEALGEDCIPNTPDDDDNNIGQDDCPSGFTWNTEICRCVTREDPNCPPGVDGNYICVLEFGMEPNECICITQEIF